MTKINLYLSCLLVAALAVACQQDEEIPASKLTADDCLNARSTRNGVAIEGEYIVALSVSEKTASGRVRGVSQIFKENMINADAVLETFEGEERYYRMKLSAEELSKIKNDRAVLKIESDRIIAICGCFSVLEPRTVTWNVNQVGYGDGTGKTAWVIDTGIDKNHPDLKVDQSRSRSFVENSNEYADDNGHGTHISGIIGALNNNIGTLGVASGASLVALKVLDENGEGKLSSLLNALSYLRTQAKAGDVVNISIGFPNVSEILEEEIRSIASRGVFFTLAAGNEGETASGYSPARTAGKNIYTISAVDSLNRFANFSNFGNDVIDYAAPGVNILSTYTDGRYAIMSGTSQAAPHVAGILLINQGVINSKGNAGSDPDGTPDVLAHQ